ncbi:MAG: signal peptide peptidase SppA [Clostridia bacterium]|nr:signal peptide peptidase SppA [Clostridia bacterium]
MGTGSGRDAIAVIHIEGTIGGATGGLFSGGADALSVMAKIRQAKDDPEAKAVVLRINSPGGSAAAAQEIAREIERLKETGKVVVASMGDSAASGGYWIAAMADRIMANPATMTGSIGVIMQTANLEELYRNVGIDYYTYKSGPHKDMGAANRPPTEEEQEIFQGMIDYIYEQVVTVVAEGRRMSRQQVLELADGRVFTGAQALELGLVDELGNYYDALALAQELAGLEGEPLVKTYDRRGVPWDSLFNFRSLLSLLPGGLRGGPDAIEIR